MWIEVFLAGALTASAAGAADDAQLYTTPYFQTLGVVPILGPVRCKHLAVEIAQFVAARVVGQFGASRA